MRTPAHATGASRCQGSQHPDFCRSKQVASPSNRLAAAAAAAATRFNQGVSEDLEPRQGPPVPLKELRKWPTACLPDRECEVSGTHYPAPDSLDANEIEWWLDLLQVRIGASRSLISNVTAGVLGSMFGLVIAGVGLAVTSGLWVAWIATLIGSALVVVLSVQFIYTADHAALEQRWMLYRRRARELDRQDSRPSHETP